MGEELHVEQKQAISNHEFSDEEVMNSQDANFISEQIEYDNSIVQYAIDETRGTIWANGHRRSMRDHTLHPNPLLGIFREKFSREYSSSLKSF